MGGLADAESMNSTEATQTVGSAGVVTRRRANSDVVRPYAVGWAVLTAVLGLQWLLQNPYSFYSWIVETGTSNSNVPQAPATWALVLIFWVKALVVVASASAPLVARKNLWVATVLGSVGFIGLLDSLVRASDATTLCALVGVAFVSILQRRRLAWFPAVLALVGPLAMSWSAGRIHLTILGFDNQSEYWGAVQRVVMPLLWVVAVASILGLAQVVRTRAQQAALADLLEDRSSALGREAVVLDERARLARDLHDVVAHRVSLIAVRAESAPFANPDLGPDATRLLAETADDARAALDELREVLGVLHRTTDRAPRTPQPGVGQIQALIDEARAAGAAVEVGGAIGAVSDTTGTTAYRVVQEALTNARRHAPEETATITFGGDDDLVIRIVNATGAPDTDVAPGRGLTGMRERVELAGGRLDVSREGQWFVVEARLPRETP